MLLEHVVPTGIFTALRLAAAASGSLPTARTVQRWCEYAIGGGIAPDALPRVFDMFQQAEASLEQSSGGLDIGLTLAAAWWRCTTDGSEFEARDVAGAPRWRSVGPSFW